MSGNQAIGTNQFVSPQADLGITDHGSDWYFTVCAIMGASTIAFMGMAMTKPQTHRIFHYITAGITAVACIAYFCMGSNLGQVPVQVEFVRPDSANVSAAGTRAMFYVRYIDWAITTPLLLLDLMLTAGIPTPTILVTILADEIMVVTGLVGSLTSSSYKFGFFVFGCAAFLFVVYELLWDGRRHATVLGGAPKKTYNLCGVWLVGLWFLYPIAWGLSEGGNVIHPDSEAIFYGILDVLAKPGFGALLILGHRNIEPSMLGLNLRTAGGNHNSIAAEKPAHGADPAVNTTTGTHHNGNFTTTGGVQNDGAVPTATSATNGHNV